LITLLKSVFRFIDGLHVWVCCISRLSLGQLDSVSAFHGAATARATNEVVLD